jgi:hypothetical protein
MALYSARSCAQEVSTKNTLILIPVRGMPHYHMTCTKIDYLKLEARGEAIGWKET